MLSDGGMWESGESEISVTLGETAMLMTDYCIGSREKAEKGFLLMGKNESDQSCCRLDILVSETK